MNSTEKILSELGRIEPRLLEFAVTAPPDTLEICGKVLADDKRPPFRANAVTLACLVSPKDGVEFIRRGLEDEDDLVRIAAVRCFDVFSNSEAKEAAQLLRLALSDSAPGVRKYALRAIQQHSINTLDPEVRLLEKIDPVPFIRTLASEIKLR